MSTTSEHSNRTLDTGTDDLLCWVEGSVAVISLNRPGRRNALSDAMYDGFASVLPALSIDPEVRVIMVTGEGAAFCAGGDVKAMNESHTSGGGRGTQPTDIESRTSWLRQRQRLVSLALHECPKPVIAAIPGAAAGAGLSIALAADIRIAAESAIVVPAFGSIGASGDFGGSWFLTQLVGPSKAKELYFWSPRLSAQEALELGIFNEILSGADFRSEALSYCHRLAARAPISMRFMKENINRAIGSDLATALDAEAVAMIRSMSTTDHKEAVAAFVEKRDATFNGR